MSTRCSESATDLRWRFGIGRSLAPRQEAGAVHLVYAAIWKRPTRFLMAACAVGLGLCASPRVDARPFVSDPGGVINNSCTGQPGPAGLSAAGSFEPPVPADGDMVCAAPPHVYTDPLRTRPGPAPGTARGDADVDPLEVGLNIGRARGHRDGMHVGFIILNGKFGIIRDRVSNARRARLQFGFQPAPHVDLGLCAADGFSDIARTGLRGRCLATIESEFSYVFAPGLAAFVSRGELGGVGGKVEYDLSKPIKDDAALVASMSYRRVPTMIGRAPDMRRWESAIKYRFYAAALMGVDVGVTLGRGTEPKSLMQENRIQAGVGLTF